MEHVSGCVGAICTMGGFKPRCFGMLPAQLVGGAPDFHFTDAGYDSVAQSMCRRQFVQHGWIS
jgi:hypothetical protein